MPLSQQEIEEARKRYGITPVQTAPSASGYAASRKARFDSITKEEEDAKKAEQSKGFVSRTAEDLKGRGSEIASTFGEAERGEITPVETGIRVVGQAAGGIGDIVGEAARSAWRTFVPDIVKEKGKEAAKAVLGGEQGVEAAKELVSKPIKAYQEFAEAHPRVAKTAEGVANIASLLPMEKGADLLVSGAEPIAKGAAETVAKSAAKRAAKTLDADVEKAITKAIRPPVSAAGSAAKSGEYLARAKTAVNAIIEHEPSLNLVDEAGESVATPESLKQFSEAIGQTKKEVFKKYSAQAAAAGDAGATVKLGKAADELEAMAGNVVLQDKDPELVKGIMEKADILRKRVEYTPEQAQEAIKLYNDSLESFYRNPSYDTASKAAVDAVVANNLRSGLDEAVESAVGPGYQELKNTYGALRSIEKDVAKRAMVDARKNAKGLLDFSDLFSGSEAVRAIVNMNPAALASSATVKGLAALYKRMNDPNVIIKNMFKAVKKAKKAAEKYGLSSETSTFLPKKNIE